MTKVIGPGKSTKTVSLRELPEEVYKQIEGFVHPKWLVEDWSFWRVSKYEWHGMAGWQGELEMVVYHGSRRRGPDRCEIRGYYLEG